MGGMKWVLSVIDYLPQVKTLMNRLRHHLHTSCRHLSWNPHRLSLHKFYEIFHLRIRVHSPFVTFSAIVDSCKRSNTPHCGPTEIILFCTLVLLMQWPRGVYVRLMRDRSPNSIMSNDCGRTEHKELSTVISKRKKKELYVTQWRIYRKMLMNWEKECWHVGKSSGWRKKKGI